MSTSPFQYADAFGSGGGGGGLYALKNGSDFTNPGTWLANLGLGDIAFTNAGRTQTFAAGDVSFVTSANGHFSLMPNGTGKVGIGTTTPLEPLHIKTNEAGAGTSLFRLDNGGTFGNEVGMEFWSSPTDDTASFRTGRIYGEWDGTGYTDTRLTLQSVAGGNTLVDTLSLKNGNVGIGTTTPSQKLDVWDGKFILSDVDVANGMTDRFATTTFFQAEIISATQGGVNIYGVSDSDSVGARVLGIIGSTNPTDSIAALSLWGGKKNTTDAQALGATETVLDIQNWGSVLVSVLGSGNVGIGTTSPTRLLQIQAGSDVEAINIAGYDIIKWNNSSQLHYGGITAAQWTQLGFWTAGAEKMTITTAGNVGIGTTTPEAKLDIFAAVSAVEGEAIRLNRGDNNRYNSIYNYSASAGGSYIGFGVHDGVTGTSQARVLTLFGTGNVGIGTTAPLATLAVHSADHNLDNYGNINVFTTDASSNNKGGDIAFGGSNGQVTSPYVFGKIRGAKEAGGTWNGYLSFGTTRTSSTVTEAMRIDSTGKVGIGTATPGALLTTAIGSGLTLEEHIRFIRLDGNRYNSIFNYSDDSGNARMDFLIHDGVGATSQADVMSLKGSGRVGINTTAPDKALEINSATGANLRLTYNDSNGGALNYADFSMSSGGKLTIAPSGGVVSITGGLGTSVQSLSGAGAVNLTTGITEVTSTGVANALMLADGAPGQEKTIIHGVDGGSFVLTPTTKTGWSTFTSTVAGESITLVFLTTRGWIVKGSYLGVIAP